MTLAYLNWRRQTGRGALTQRAFGDQAAARAAKSKRGVIVYRDIALAG